MVPTCVRTERLGHVRCVRAKKLELMVLEFRRNYLNKHWSSFLCFLAGRVRLRTGLLSQSQKYFFMTSLSVPPLDFSRSKLSVA